MIKISDSELEVMKILWEYGDTNSLEIIEKLQNHFNWNESTIRTLITRLEKKKAIEKVRKEGRIYTYTAKIKENEYKLKASRRFVEILYDGSVNNMLLSFVKEKDISKEELKSLIDLIDSEDE
ncbi:MAG: BlaI/MecI/CopY family transcriptional regulator [Clostridia bacterium]|nr:BlaI/MecI/CopY family transcriptional regulator [Clostridia bacterium]